METYDFAMLLASCVAVVFLIVSVIWTICDCRIARYNVEKVLDENKRLKVENKHLKAKVKKYIKTGR